MNKNTNNNIKAFFKSSTVKKTVATVLLYSIAGSAFAAGGLDSASDEIDEISTWLYGVMGGLSTLYVMWNVVLAMADKKEWTEVLMALGKVALAGGILVGADFAWNVWGS